MMRGDPAARPGRRHDLALQFKHNVNWDHDYHGLFVSPLLHTTHYLYVTMTMLAMLRHPLRWLCCVGCPGWPERLVS